MVIEIGKTYRTAKGTIVTVTDSPSGLPNFPFLEDNNRSYTLEGKYLENATHEEDLVEEFTGFRTQQEIWGYLVNGGYVLCGTQLLGFYEGSLSTFNLYGEVVFTDTTWFFNVPKDWSIGFPQPKPEPKWYDNIPEQGILCWVDDYYKDRQLITGLKVVIAHEPEKDKPFIVYRSEASGTVSYKYATPATLDGLANYIYECE